MQTLYSDDLPFVVTNINHRTSSSRNVFVDKNSSKPTSGSQAPGREQEPSSFNDEINHHHHHTAIADVEAREEDEPTEPGKDSDSEWGKLRMELMDVRVQCSVPAKDTCDLCSRTASPLYVCFDCGPKSAFCASCCASVHKHSLFHKPLIWTGQMYIPAPDCPVPVFRSACPESACSPEARAVDVFDHHGRQHLVQMEFCRHEKDSLTVVRNGLWPSSIKKPRVAFTMALMELCVELQVNAKLSLFAICAALKQAQTLRPLLPPAVPSLNLYRVLSSESLNEYRYQRTKLLNLSSAPGFELSCCIPCDKNPSKSVICMDGNFGLVHKKRRTKSSEEPRHAGPFFLNKDDVASYIKDVYKQKPRKTTQLCSNFQAGDDPLRPKSKNIQLDVTGVFGSVCQHDFPRIFMDLEHGERLGYPLLLLEHLKQKQDEKKMEPGKKQIVMYDVACQFHPFVQRRRKELTDHFTFVLPAFHSHAHNLNCQLTYGQKYTDGCGRVDGENVERLWAYLRGFKGMTKEMNYANRHDLLTDALFHYAFRAFLDLPCKLKNRLDRAKQNYSTAKTVLENIEEQVGGVETGEMWLSQWKEHANTARTKAKAQLTVVEEYCLTKVMLEKKRAQLISCTASKRATVEGEEKRLANKYEDLQSKLPTGCTFQQPIAESARKKMEDDLLGCAMNLAQERHKRQDHADKYSDGQASNKHFTSLVKKTTKKLTEVCQDLQDLGCNARQQDLFDPTSQAYSSIAPMMQRVKMDGATAEAEKKRAIEEYANVCQEIVFLVSGLQEKNKGLAEAIQNGKSKGFVNAVLQHKLIYENLLTKCVSVFATVVQIEGSFDTTAQSIAGELWSVPGDEEAGEDEGVEEYEEHEAFPFDLSQYDLSQYESDSESLECDLNWG